MTMPRRLLIEQGGPGPPRPGAAGLRRAREAAGRAAARRGVARRAARCPQVSEPEVVRHFIELSTLNHHVDRGFYPLGSCTMKHNPKIDEELAALPGFARAHPLAGDEATQGALRVMAELAATCSRRSPASPR